MPERSCHSRGGTMKSRIAIFSLSILCLAGPALAQTNNPSNPTWWNKYQFLASGGHDPRQGSSPTFRGGGNGDGFNEGGAPNGTFIGAQPSKPPRLAARPNRTFLRPMR